MRGSGEPTAGANPLRFSTTDPDPARRFLQVNGSLPDSLRPGQTTDSCLGVKGPFKRRAPIMSPGLYQGICQIGRASEVGQSRGQRPLRHGGSAQRPRQLRTGGHHPRRTGAPAHRKPDAHRAAVAVGRGQAGTFMSGLPTPP